MYIKDLSNNVKDERCSVLERIFDTVGNNCMSGYLEYGIHDMSYDEFNHLCFDSYNLTGDLETLSHGTIMDDNSLVIRQVQNNNKDKKYFQIFGVSSDGKKYTYLDFESEEAMMEADMKIRRGNANLCLGDITDTLREIGVDFDTIGQVRVNVDFPGLELTEMMEDSEKKEEETNSFVMY